MCYVILLDLKYIGNTSMLRWGQGFIGDIDWININENIKCLLYDIFAPHLVQ